MEQQKNQEKSISEQLSQVLDKLSLDQVRYVVARQEFSTDKEAAASINLKPDTIYRWPTEVKEAVRLMAFDGLATAQHIRRKALAKAMLVKVKGLDSNDDVLRQRVATEIIEWEMGKATNRTEVAGPEGGPVQVEDVNETRRRLLESIERSVETDDSRPEGGVD